MPSPHTIRTIGLLANTNKAASRNLARAAITQARRLGLKVCTEPATARLLPGNVESHPDAAALARHCDALLILGGDGTVLRAARDIQGARTPLLGINLGGLGFLTGASSRQLTWALTQLAQGGYDIEARPMIECWPLAKAPMARHLALNEFVIARKNGSRLIELEVTVNGQELTRYRCDGLILSSPTGSTGYSLSAGGAIVSPTAEVFALTPICPHTLSNRSLILNLDSSIAVKAVCHTPEITVSGDGENLFDLTCHEIVKVERSRHVLRFLHLPGTSFYKTLRQKLDWSGAHV